MNKQGKLLFSMAILGSVAACFSIVTATMAWYVPFESREIDGGASTFSSYFAGGEGTEDDPYQIANSTQMYNFAWLQYLGIFNADEDNDGEIDKQVYLVLNNDIDMTGMVIPPIGTVKNPFLGNFDGNDYVISNLVTSNVIDTTAVTADKIYRHPEGVTNLQGETEVTNYGEVNVLGFFGVIGTSAGLGSTANLTYDREVAIVHNFYLDKVTIVSKTSNELMGIVAGYLGAPEVAEDAAKISVVKDIGVYQSSISVPSGSTGLNSTYGSKISKYSLIGDYSDNTIEWGESGDSGETDEFGGSIDMLTLTRRVNYMSTSADTWSGNSSNIAASDNNFHTSFYYQISGNKFSSSTFYWKMTTTPSTSAIAYFQTGTYIPINVEKSDMGLDVDTEQTATVTINGTTSSNYTNTYYSTANNAEIVSDTNTGYIVGGGSGGSSANLGNSAMRVRIQQSGMIYKSLGLTAYRATLAAGADVDTKLKMVTYKGSGAGYVITDDTNTGEAIPATLTAQFSNSAKYNSTTLDLQRYSNVKTQISASIKKTGKLLGLGPVSFMQTSLTLPVSSETDYVLPVQNVKIHDSSSTLLHTNYQFVKGAINCSLHRQGYLTTVLGSCTNTNNQFGFDLYKVTRDSSGNLTGYTLINNVCYDKTTDTSVINSTASGNYQEVYNKSWYSSLPPYIAYYIEIPLPAGDYAIGDDTSHGTTAGAYFLYLDIGANGGGTTPTPTESKSYQVENVRFVATKGNIADYVDILFELTFAAGSDGSVFFKHNGLTANEMLITVTNISYEASTTEVTVTESTSAATWNGTLA